jgi:protocatechuate 3,4-dioxygenase beta subunit
MRGIYESFLTIGVILIMATLSGASTCKPTPADQLGPFYKPNAPVRTSVGTGYVLSGEVKSSKDCAPIERARIEFWLAGLNGKYDDDHRATMSSDKSGSYRLESNSPPGYSGRPPHIHIRVSAPGYKTLVTQHYPVAGQTTATFHLVLVPE